MAISGVGLPDKSTFHRHRDMNMCDKHMAKDCLTCDEEEKCYDACTFCLHAPCMHIEHANI